LAFAVVWATWLLFLTGAIAVAVALMQRSMSMGWGWTLTFGIVAFAAGVVALTNPPATLAAILSLISAFALASGVVLVTCAVRLSSLRDKVVSAAHPATT